MALVLCLPVQYTAAECIAKWTHPTLFTDINPDASLQELNHKFCLCLYPAPTGSLLINKTAVQTND